VLGWTSLIRYALKSSVCAQAVVRGARMGWWMWWICARTR